MHILLVEDHEPSAKVERALLEELGHQCDVVTNGAKAVEKFTANSYALVIMDLQLPDMDGLEVTKRIRKFEQKDGRISTPILGVTGRATEDDRLLCKKAGMNGYLSKPFRMHELEEKLQDYL